MEKCKLGFPLHFVKIRFHKSSCFYVKICEMRAKHTSFPPTSPCIHFHPWPQGYPVNSRTMTTDCVRMRNVSRRCSKAKTAKFGHPESKLEMGQNPVRLQNPSLSLNLNPNKSAQNAFSCWTETCGLELVSSKLRPNWLLP